MKKIFLTLGSIALMNIVYLHAYAAPLNQGNPVNKNYPVKKGSPVNKVHPVKKGSPVSQGKSGAAPATKSAKASGDEEKEKLGWGFSFMLGAGEASSKSNDNDAKVDSLTQGKPSTAKTESIPAVELSIRYAFNKNWSTELTIQSISAKYTFANPISLSATIGMAGFEYWANPYKTGSDRTKHTPKAPIFIFGLGGIGPFSLNYSTMNQKYDDSDLEDVSADIYGTALTDAERSDLKRPGAVTKFSISTGIPVYQNEKSEMMIMILGGYDRETKKAAGKSEAYVNPAYNLGFRTGLGGFALTLQRNWGVKQYEKENPVFRIIRKDDSSMNTLMAEFNFSDNFGLFWRVEESNLDSNINFYDTESQMMVVGINMMY